MVKKTLRAAMRRRWFAAGRLCAGLAVLLGVALAAGAAPPKLPRAEPADVGMDAGRLAVIDDLVHEGLRRNQMPGAVVLVGRQGKVVYFKAFGHRHVEPDRRPMTTDTVFDMASITKPVATATSLMKLVEQEKLHPRDAVADHIPEFGCNGKEPISIYQLLTHQSGLIADNPLSDYNDGPEKAFQRIWDLKPVAEPGSRFIYSDVNYIVLGEIVRRLSGDNLHAFSRKHVFEPLGMSETGFLPDESLRGRSAPTEKRDGTWIQGEVHDPRAHRLGGIAGHAGLFSTAEDLAVYAQMMLGRGEYAGVRVLDEAVVDLMTTSCEVPGGGLRGLGWDMRTGYSSNRGDLCSSRAFGHGGFTGTVLWIDPELDLFVIFLSNRVHPDGKGLVNPLAGRIGTLAVAAVRSGPLKPTPAASDETRATRGLRQRPAGAAQVEPVLTGLDVLERDGFAALAGRRLGLITNHTGVNRDGVSAVELFHNAANVELRALFSPEHGFEGRLDISNVKDSRDSRTGLKVHSLYGATRTPTPEMLDGLDTLVFDIQDIGARFYTYVSTMKNAMRAAAEHGLRFVVLDRPNPINGVDVAGPVLDPGSESFVGAHPIAVRHGMTVGELARMIDAELDLKLDLVVVRVEGWRREDCFDATGLTWINPSPNMRSLTQAVLYPGIGLLETTNLSVGRGTDTPFEVVGAPWIDGRQLAAELNAARLGGVRFVPIDFTPDSSKFAGERCGGVNIVVTNREAFAPVRTGLEIARQLRRLYPDAWETKSFNRLLANRRTFDATLAGRSVDEMEVTWEPELREFLKRRQQFLFYE
ncbi:MAG TPA: exo-beta-N-acetylmuramidase NamZ domain-containing protein [Planctomycetaceae bacterium]|nr:exo-beta-N-acetylmuramidase NamZ domain-containing protein [Planctomycetaceae bacterium]